MSIVRLAPFALLPVLATSACSSSELPDGVVGPYTGARHRFVIDRFELPTGSARAVELGDDLDGDGTRDNAFGNILLTLASGDNVTPHGPDMIAAGVIASTIELVADDPLDDDTVGVWLYGADGAAAEPMGGVLEAGTFASNRLLTTRPTARATLHLPIFVDADPTVIEAVAVQLDLVPDGQGGYDGLLRGAFRVPDAQQAALAGIRQLLDARPHDHRWFWHFVDADRDGDITLDDMTQGFMGSLLEPDLALTIDGRREELLSFGFAVHVSPCAEGRCATAPASTCFDRIHNGDETDVDCGGGCGACGAGATCSAAPDCHTEACDAGSCRAPACDDGVRNGFEADIDCGGACPTACASTATCLFDADCASGRCLPDHICY